MISPQPVFLHPLDFWKTNLNQLQLQQLASSNIATTSSPASAGGGGGEGSGNNHHQDGLMAAAAGGAGGVEGEGGGWGTNMPNMPLLSMSERARLARVPRREEGLKCPRCDSTNTKFRYFNNYSLSEPRHFCRACRRYWTRGGALRDRNVGLTRVQPPRQAKRTTRPKATAENQDGQAQAVE